VIIAITAKEFKDALLTCVKLVQNIAYKEEIQELLTKLAISQKSKLKSFSPFFDNHGFLSV
jgi:hypothetical protein